MRRAFEIPRKPPPHPSMLTMEEIDFFLLRVYCVEEEA